jgi:peptidoglycan hydrolase-like protein with peptidoglycan-binding domain
LVTPPTADSRPEEPQATTSLDAQIDQSESTIYMDGVGKNFNGYKDIKTPFPNPFNKDEYSKIEIQNNQGAVIATYENKEGGSTTLLVGDGKDVFYFDPGTEDFNPTEYKVVLTKTGQTGTTEIPLADKTITKADRNIVLNTPTDAAATKTGENLVLSAKFPTGEANTFYNAEQLAGSGLSLNLAITVGGEVRTITVPLQGLTVAPETQDPTKLNIQIPPDNLNMIQGQITKIDFSASTEPSDAAKIATIDTDIDFSDNASVPTPTNNNQNQTSVVPNNTTTTNNTVQSSSTPSSSTASTMNPPPITVGNRTITGFESAVILQAALRNNKDPKTNQPYYSGLITGNWDEPSANALKKYIADNTGKPIEKTLPKGTENVSGKLAEDGQFGPQTEAAIKAFQEYYNTKNTVKPIKIDGILGPETELAMNTQFNMTLFKTT